MGSLNVQEPDIKPPDGGLRAWLQVLCGHLILFNVWGYINSFGIFQSYYVDALNSSASDVSWVGSLQIFFVYFLGAFSGRATDAGYLRTILVVGLFLQLLGVFMTSLATSYWQILLAQGICQGIGDGLLLCPVVAVVSTYFTTKRTMAISISASGGATGGLVFPAIAQNLLHRIGFPWTVRVMGFVILFNAVIILTFMRQRLPARQKGPLIEWKAFKELSYTLFTCGEFFCFWAVYFAYYYVRSFGSDIIHVSNYTSFSILMVINGLGLPGRIIPAYVSDQYFGTLNTFIIVSIAAAIVMYCWIAIDSLGGLIAFAVVYGFFGGGMQSLFPAALSSLTTDISKAGVRIGMVFSLVSIASLTGPPIAGALVDVDQGRYLGAQLFGGTSIILGCLFLIGARCAKVGMGLWNRI